MSFVFDAMAILSYLSDLKGADLIDKILDSVILKEAKVFINYLTLSELYYVVGSEQGMSKANEAVVAVRKWPVEFVEVGESIALAAGRLMIKEDIPMHDAIVVATAIDRKAALVTPNPRLAEVYEDTILLGEHGGS